MKAEHRKELQTNVLADRVGKMVETMKHRPKGRGALYVVLAIVAVVGLLFVSQWRKASARANSERWFQLEDGARNYINTLIKDYPGTNPGRAARFQFAWYALWEQGVKVLGADSGRALKNLDVARGMYQELATEVASDPVWEPEALYHLAVIEETLAVQNRDKLTAAQKMYKDLADKHKDSAYGKLAADRAKQLEPGSRHFEDSARFYADLQNSLKINPPQLFKQ